MDYSVENLQRFNQPKLSGILKKKPEYFKVTEINLFDPNGEGQHLFLRVQRKGFTTFEVCNLLRKVFETRPNSVGYAGLKDKVALVIQIFSVKFDKNRVSDVEATLNSYIEKAKQFDLEISLYFPDNFTKSLNSKKLRSGLLKGNSFEVIISNIDTTDIKTAVEGFQKRATETPRIPNYYGEQRVGKRGKNAREGFKKLQIAQQYLDSLDKISAANRKGFRSFLKKRKKDNESSYVIDTFGSFQKFTAFQAALFNLTLSKRILSKDTEIATGDKVISQYGGKVSTHDFKEESSQEKIHLTFALPLIGERANSTEYQNELLDKLKFSKEVFSIAGLDGGYRPCLLHASSLNLEISAAVDLPPNDLPAACFQFSLPKGSFATNLLREYVSFREIESDKEKLKIESS